MIIIFIFILFSINFQIILNFYLRWFSSINDLSSINKYSFKKAFYITKYFSSIKFYLLNLNFIHSIFIHYRFWHRSWILHRFSSSLCKILDKINLSTILNSGSILFLIHNKWINDTSLISYSSYLNSNWITL